MALDGRPPTITLESAFQVVAFAELLEWATSLQLLNGCEGMGKLRKTLRSDPRQEQLLHAGTQLELARLAKRLGGTARLEPRLQGAPGPVDMTVAYGDLEAVVEVRILLTDQAWRRGLQYDERVKARVREIELRHDVSCDVAFSEELESGVLAVYLAHLSEVAAEVAMTGESREVEIVGARTCLKTGGGGSRFTGPVRPRDTWQRVAARLREKSAKHKASVPLWLRLDVRNGLWQLTDWSRTPLVEKLNSLVPVLRHELSRSSYIAGVVLSSGALMAQGGVHEETCLGSNGASALRRSIPPMRARETLIVPVHRDAEASTALWRQLYDSETTWLEWALAEVEQPSLAAVLA